MIEFKSRSVEYYPNGNLKRCKLTKPTAVKSFTCNSWIHFFEDGHVNMYRTEVDISTNDYIIPSQSTVFMSQTEPHYIKHIWLSKNTEIQGHKCRGKGKISTSFYPNGSIKSMYIDSDRYIQNHPCKGGLFTNIMFFSDGQLKSYTLSKDTFYQNTTIEKNSRILLDRKGKMQIIED